MMNVVADQNQKKIFNLLSKYIQSNGVKLGEIIFDDFSHEVKYSNLDNYFKGQIHFANKRHMILPLSAYDFIKKLISDSISGESHIVNVDDIGTSFMRIEIDTIDKSISGYFEYYMTKTGEESSYDWSEDDEAASAIIGIIKTSPGINLNQSRVLRLEYSGGGDSGYLESAFNDRGGPVPSLVDDWCYRVLTDLHNGWEINEGSQGYFEFDLNNNTILLEHSFNEDFFESENLFRVSFG